MSSGLTRFRSAPSSLIGELCDEFLPMIRPSSFETENMLERLLTPDLRAEVLEKTAAGQLAPPEPQAQNYSTEVSRQQDEGIFSASQMMFHAQQHQYQQMPQDHSSVESTYPADGGVATSPNIIRQSSSPAALFSHLNGENTGYGLTRVMDGFGNGDSSVGGAANRLQGQLSFPSRQNSIMSQVSEMAAEVIADIGFSVSSWEQASILPDNSNLSGFKRRREEEKRTVDVFNSTELQNGEMRSQSSCLAHHMSLPKTSSEMAAMEKYLQFHDTVPWKVRAKRGCATHPRSIAERVRRTKISERMRKLQELVPNMDKQTNTADMLDLAVDYIKDLQKQVKALTESCTGCSCSPGKQMPYANP